MEAFLVSLGVVGVAEIGDKTQLLALFLAAKFGKPWPIILGILVATIVNHGIAGLAGTLFAHDISGSWLRWLLGISFLGVGVWAVFPDRHSGPAIAKSNAGAFAATVIAFFLAEIGDKTQIATVALAARFDDFLPVVAGTTAGMMLANLPAVFLGDRLADRVPVRLIRYVAAAVFVTLGILTLLGVRLPRL